MKLAMTFWPRVFALMIAGVMLSAQAQQSPASNKNELKSLLAPSSTVATNQDDYLPPDQAFQFSASMTRPDAIDLSWTIAPAYYLYRDQFFRVTTEDTSLVQLGTPQFPEGKTKHDEWNGEQVVFYNELKVTVPVARAADASGTFTIKVRYQGCAEAGLCYNPMTKTVTLELPSTSAASTLAGKAASDGSSGGMVSEQDRLAAALQGDNVFYALALFFGAGVLLSLTPCVLPMIPILSGIIVGQGENITRAKSFSLAMTYVQGMALTYAALGAIFALVFQQAPQAFFQQPWIVMLMVALFVALAFAMFGAYTLQMPSALQTKLTDASNKQKAGTFIGTFIMGALSALVVTACVAPAIVAALTVIIQSKQVFLGAAALYASGIGMGIPLLIVGASAGSLLPKAGAWMDTVKQLFGVLFLGVAIYLLQPLIPGTAAMFLWAALAVISGYWLFALVHGAKAAPSVIRGFGLMILVYGIALLIGALAGRTDPLQPLAGLGQGGAANSVASTEHATPFKRVKSVADLDREIAAANAAGKWVMFDFYADWCVSCKEMEKFTFVDPAVAAQLNTMVLLQADVTDNDDIDQELLKRFGIFGPPSILFFGLDGQERKDHRVVGYMKAEKFSAHVAAVLRT
jgi:thiol:disulfide interchange protein DsbD